MFSDLKGDYKINNMDPLKYLKDHTDIRTRNISCGKIQSRQAISSTCSLNSQMVEGSCLLFRVIPNTCDKIALTAELLVVHRCRKATAFHAS